MGSTKADMDDGIGGDNQTEEEERVGRFRSIGKGELTANVPPAVPVNPELGVPISKRLMVTSPKNSVLLIVAAITTSGRRRLGSPDPTRWDNTKKDANTFTLVWTNNNLVQPNPIFLCVQLFQMFKP